MNMYRTVMVAAFASLLGLFSSTPLAGDLGVEGTVTATTFVGNGSGLTGVVKAEADPQVGSVTGSKWCVGDGAAVQCNQNAPVTTEVDPLVGILDADKWCKADATASEINCDQDAPVKMPNAPSEDAKSYPGAACQPNNWTDYERAVFSSKGIMNADNTVGLWVTCPITRDAVRGTDGALVRVSVHNEGGAFSCALHENDISGNPVGNVSTNTSETGGRIFTLELAESTTYGYYSLTCTIAPRSTLFSYRVYEPQDGYDNMTDYDN